MVHLSYLYMITEKTTALTTADEKQISVHGAQEGMYKWSMRVGLLPLRENWLSTVKRGVLEKVFTGSTGLTLLSVGSRHLQPGSSLDSAAWELFPFSLSGVWLNSRHHLTALLSE